MYVTETQVYCVEDAENSLVMVGKMVDTIVCHEVASGQKHAVVPCRTPTASVVARKSVSAALRQSLDQ